MCGSFLWTKQAASGTMTLQEGSVPYEAVLEGAKRLSRDEKSRLITILKASMEENQDCRAEYPASFWDLFGSAPDYPAVPEDIPYEGYDDLKGMY